MVVTHSHPPRVRDPAGDAWGFQQRCVCPLFLCAYLLNSRFHMCVPSTLQAPIYLWLAVGGIYLVSLRSEHNRGIRPLCCVTPGTWWHTSPSTSHLIGSDCSLLYCPALYCARGPRQCVALSSNTPFTNTPHGSDLTVAALDLGPLFLSPFGSGHYHTPHPQPPSNGYVACAISRTMIQCNFVLGALGPGIPHIINTKLRKQFTCLTYNNGRSGAACIKKKAVGRWQ